MLPTMTTRKLVIFTDLDGTLLGWNTYSFEPALPALNLIKQKGVPLILSSSKTRAEIELFQKQLENSHPFVSENGGAIFIPKDYFSFPFHYDRELGEYFVLELGTPYSIMIEVLDLIRKETGISIKGFSDFTEEELSSFCGLGQKEAKLAKKREYDEPFMIEGGEKEVEIVRRKIKQKEMNYAWGGRFHHIFGKNDKGKAVGILKELYKTQFFSIFSVGIGDSLNDLPMLSSVDYPIFLKEKDFPPEALSPIQNVRVINGGGSGVWNEVILKVVKELEIWIRG
jgi:mannosyl-3-phosphoglycerate phosphatase